MRRWRDLVADVGGHDLRAILEAYEAAGRERDRPSVILAHTIKGWGLPFAGDPLNHTMLLTQSADRCSCARSLGIAQGDEWAGFAPGTRGSRAHPRAAAALRAAAAARRTRRCPEQLDETYPAECSTQEAFGRVLGRAGPAPGRRRAS